MTDRPSMPPSRHRPARAITGRTLPLLGRPDAFHGIAIVLLPSIVLAAILGTGGTDPADPGDRDAGDAVAAAAPHQQTGTAAPGPADAVADAAPATAPATATAADARAAVPAGPVRFASYQDLELFLPSTRAMLSGFHEASYRHAVRMRPWGSPLANDNPRKDARPPSDPGPNYVIMSTRGRPTHATSAADIAVPSDAVITSPVDGTVVEAEPYSLYGTYPDNRIRIRPTARPDLVVTVLHVTGPRVAVGDTVTAGETPIAASATDFPFPSHVDAYSGGHPPHVHIEVKRG